jgi:cytochrome c oxidase subunit 3
MAHETALPHAGITHHGAHTGHWEYSIPPFIVSFGILALILAFIFQFVYHLPFAAVIALGIGIPLIIGGITGWVSEALSQGEGLSYGAMGWFILAEAMIFLSLFCSYWFMRLTMDWPPAGTPHLPKLMPLVMTATLVASSVTIHKGEALMHAGDNAGLVRWMLLTIALGGAFLGMSALEWNHLIHEGFAISTNAYGAVFFGITGLHGSHVLVGLAIFIAALFPALKGKVSQGYVRTAALYWHFVDIIWFFVVSQVYFW